MNDLKPAQQDEVRRKLQSKAGVCPCQAQGLCEAENGNLDGGNGS